MSDVGLELDRPRRHMPRRRLFGCLAVLVALALLAGGGFLAVSIGLDAIRSRMSGPADYPGPGTGSVLVEVKDGDTATDIARTLAANDVVQSAEAFVDAARAEPAAVGIQVGFYELKEQMAAEQALAVLIEPDNLMQSAVTIPEGLRVEQVVEVLADKTDFSARQFEQALDRPRQLGLPGYAEGNPEGYLFPATYTYRPDATPADMLAAMVDRWRRAAKEANLQQAAKRLGYTPAELMVVASLVEAEANRDADRGKVARVIYNRLESNVTGGLLQIDATVNYALGRDLGLGLTQEDLAIDSPYNTRKFPGLPPGPIESPGDKAIEAAVKPTPGPWVYYVTVNLETGETKFAEAYKTFLKYRRELEAWCQTSDRC